MRQNRDRYRCPDPTVKGDLTDAQIELCEKYLKNDMRELENIVWKIVRNFGVGRKTNEEFHGYLSLANIELWKAAVSYENDKCDNFHAYLVFRLTRKMTQELRDGNRYCRKQSYIEKDEDGNPILDKNGKPKRIYINPISLNAESERTGKTIGEIIGITDDAIEHIFDAEKENNFSEPMKKYLHTLTKKQRDILHMVESGIPVYQIQEKLGISEAMYNYLWEDMTSVEKTRGLESLFCVRF